MTNDKTIKYMHKRRGIQLVFMGITFILGMIIWCVNPPENVPHILFWVDMVLVPFFCFGIFFRMNEYLFVRHWYYVLYMVTTLALFTFVMLNLSYDYQAQDKSRLFFVSEIWLLIVTNVIGLLLSIFVSLPFKLVHAFIFNVDFYYNYDSYLKLQRQAFPEEHKEERELTKQSLKYDTMNETQLNVELKNAVDNEQYEDADTIRKILNTKYK